MELWCPFAVHRPGPAQKVGYPGGVSGLDPSLRMTAPKWGEVKHSAEGDSMDGAHGVLDNLGINSSWHFTVGYDVIEQHYTVNTNCWHGNDTDNDDFVRANIDLIGIEHLGKAGEPLTEYQIDATTRLTKWLANSNGYYGFKRFPVEAGLWCLAEHKEVGNSWTACPSDRIPWSDILQRLGVSDQVAGVGAHYTDGSGEEIWTPRLGKKLDGIGARYFDGRIQQLWPK